MKTNLSFQDFTTKMIVLIKGESREAIEQDFWGFYNHNGTDGGQAKADEPHLEWLTDDFTHGGYFYTDRERLLRSMVSRSLFKMLNDSDEFKKHDPEGHAHCCKGIKGGFLPQARINAQEWFDGMEKITDIIKQRTESAGDPDNHGAYSLGTIRAEKPDKHS
tara:strand:+ start:119 stop:604 length:486 start_codon:yes stop_codon:yes gene_type:complete